MLRSFAGSLPRIRHHPWILEGYDGPPPSYLPPSNPIEVVDDEIVDELVSMGLLKETGIAPFYGVRGAYKLTCFR